MTCEDATDLIIDSIMESLDQKQAEELAAHIRSCSACAAEAIRLNEIWMDLGKIEVPGMRRREGANGVAGNAVPDGVMDLHRGRRRMGARLAASLALLLVGGAVGYQARGIDRGVPVGPGGPPTEVARADETDFLLLVRGTEPDAQVAGPVLVEEYANWAGSLAVEGRLVAANKLMDEPGRWISGASVEDGRDQSDVQGYFVVRARTYEDAIELGMASPHIRYGGVFEIREIDPLN